MCGIAGISYFVEPETSFVPQLTNATEALKKEDQIVTAFILTVKWALVMQDFQLLI